MKPLHLLPLAHHRVEHANRCVLLPLGGRRVALCARCLGLYPAMFLAFALQWALHLGPLGRADLLIAVGLALPGLLDWGEGILNPGSGNNARRLITGAMLGIALGRTLWLHAQNPWGELLWIQMFVLAAGVVAFLILRRIRPEGDDGL